MTVPRFWREIENRYNLIGTKCKKCGTYYFPPRSICPKCRRSGVIVKHKFKGTGEVVTYTVVHSSPENFERQIPYVLAIIKLDEGSTFTAQVVCRPEEIRIGTRVRAVFRKIAEENKRGVIYYGTKFVIA